MKRQMPFLSLRWWLRAALIALAVSFGGYLFTLMLAMLSFTNRAAMVWVFMTTEAAVVVTAILSLALWLMALGSKTRKRVQS